MWRWATAILSVALVLIVLGGRNELMSYLPDWATGGPEADDPVKMAAKTGQSEAEPAAPKVSVIAVAAKPGSLPILRRTIGTVVPLLSTAISSPVSGNISEIVAKDGKPVRAGDLLVRLDDRVIKANIQRDNAILAKDQATLDDALTVLERTKTLTKDGADSKQAGDDALAAVRVAQGAIDTDKANLAADKVLLSQTEIRAPFDGTLGAFLLSPGAFVAPGDTVVTLTQMKPVYAEFTLPETDLALARSSYAAGKLSIRVSPMLLGGNSAVSSGPITFIDNAIDVTSATFKLRALLANDGQEFWPGQSLNVTVDAGTVDKLVLIPLVAVQSQTDGAICYVVKPDRTIEIRQVDVALRVGDQAGIVRGLSAGELVVTEGQSSLEEGTPVILQKTRPEIVPDQTRRQQDQ